MEVFVFGSNLAGRHGAGSAKEALIHHGAIYGQGVGRQGNSYAIPTKDEKLRTLPLDEISCHVAFFKVYAAEKMLTEPDLRFRIVKIGCGLAGYSEEEIAPMFTNTPANCLLPEGWSA
jgi:hypothetical protein